MSQTMCVHHKTKYDHRCLVCTLWNHYTCIIFFFCFVYHNESLQGKAKATFETLKCSLDLAGKSGSVWALDYWQSKWPIDFQTHSWVGGWKWARVQKESTNVLKYQFKLLLSHSTFKEWLKLACAKKKLEVW
jgi:hypothetical protein